MTNEQINQAVAEELGWTQIQNSSKYWYRPGESLGVEANFTDDYNAAAEMRKGIDNRNDRLKFFNALTLILGQSTCDWEEFNATPRQQAEAFLKMRGKWREE